MAIPCRYISKSAAVPALSQLKSCVFASLATNKKSIVSRHHLDTHRKEYLEVIDSVVIPVCQEIVPKEHLYHERIGKSLKHTLFIIDLCWGFHTELAYRTLAPKAQQTDANLKRMRILRAAQDILFTTTCLIDDTVEHARVRFNKPTWHTISEGGQTAAIYDSLVYSHLPHFLADKFFRDEPFCGQIMEYFTNAAIGVMVGQCIDRITLKRTDNPEINDWIINYKGGKVHIPMIGMLLAGYSDRQLLSQVEDIFSHFGIAAQIWDDFHEVQFADILRKEPIDLTNGNISWATSQALKTLSGNELSLFKECYGSCDPQKMKTVQEIYHSINLPLIYMKEMISRAAQCAALIDELPDDKCKEFCRSYADWLLGDSKDIEIVQNYIARH